MAQQFNKGDIVILKSGGPKMTVDNVSGDQNQWIKCKWFSGSKVQSEVFDADALRHAEEDNG